MTTEYDPASIAAMGATGVAALTIAALKLKEMFRSDDVGGKVSGETKDLIDSLKGERDIAIKERDEAIARADSLQVKLDEERTLNADLKSQVAKLSSDVDHIQKSLVKVQQDFEDIKALYRKVSDALLDAKIENAKMEGHIKGLEREIGRRAGFSPSDSQ
jgi:chromosome segregation ATPase